MSAVTLYLESSALLSLALEQGPFERIAARLDRAEKLVTSRLTRIECARALLRVEREGLSTPRSLALVELDLELLFERVELFEIEAEVAALAGRIAPSSALISDPPYSAGIMRPIRSSSAICFQSSVG